MKNRKFLIVLAGIAGVFVLICLACGILVLNTASSPTFQATMTAQAIARITPNVTSTSTSAPQPTQPPLPTSTLPLPTATSTQTPTPIPVKVSAKQTVNVRQGPGTQFAIVGKLDPNTSIIALGKNQDGQWLQVPIPDAANPGWVAVSVVSVSGAIESLRVAVVLPTSTSTRVVSVVNRTPTLSAITDLTLAEKTYALTMAKVSDDYVLAMEGMVSLANSVKTNPYLLVDSQWKSDMALVLALLSKLSRDIRNVNPPTRFASVHADWLDASTHMDKFVTYMSEGIDEIDNNKLLKAGDEIDLITAAMSRATSKIKSMTQAGQTAPTALPVSKTSTITLVPSVAKNVKTNLQGKWEITYVGEYRDKTVYFYDTGKTAFGVWATVQLRIKNLQSGSDRIGKSYSFVAIDQGGKIYEENFDGTLNAAWQYCGCGSHVDELGPGQETVIVIAFDVPESTQSLIIAPTTSAFSATPLSSPRFGVANFAQVPAWKPKK